MINRLRKCSEYKFIECMAIQILTPVKLLILGNVIDTIDQNGFVKIRIFLVIVLVPNMCEMGLDVIILHPSHLQTFRQSLFVLP